jgi:hypothetical protein
MDTEADTGAITAAVGKNSKTAEARRFSNPESISYKPKPPGVGGFGFLE